MNHYSTKSKSFLVMGVHANEIGLAYVQDGKLCDTVQFNYSQDLDSSSYPNITRVWPQIKSYFDKVDDILAYNLVVHKTNLKEILAYHGLELPKKKYVCVYYWARAVLGTTSLKSIYEAINTPAIPNHVLSPLILTDSEHQAELIALIALYLQNLPTGTSSLEGTVKSMAPESLVTMEKQTIY
ncbi:hypothetical protein [Telluribacter humicola]|uniref:hypothetical protein n=1 Tax=Telluribacter humicola TaxID=1720261 RepID=UPI001A96A569|nr:hypothetical protein [Telluribacter humicola]